MRVRFFSHFQGTTNQLKSQRYVYNDTVPWFLPSFNRRNGLQTVTTEPWNSTSAIFTTIRIFFGPSRISWCSSVYRIRKTRNSSTSPRNLSKTIPNKTLPSNFIPESFRTPGVDRTREPPKCSSVMAVLQIWEESCGRLQSERLSKEWTSPNNFTPMVTCPVS